MANWPVMTEDRGRVDLASHPRIGAGLTRQVTLG